MLTQRVSAKRHGSGTDHNQRFISTVQKYRSVAFFFQQNSSLYFGCTIKTKFLLFNEERFDEGVSETDS